MSRKGLPRIPQRYAPLAGGFPQVVLRSSSLFNDLSFSLFFIVFD